MLHKIILRGGTLFLSASLTIGIVISALFPASASARTLPAPAATCISEILSADAFLEDNGYTGSTDPIQLERIMREIEANATGAFLTALEQHLAEVDYACGTS